VDKFQLHLCSIGKPEAYLQTQFNRVFGLFISFEGTEGSGKSTHTRILAERLQSLRRTVRLLREPGGTPIGEEIRHTLQHSHQNQAMTAETELLLLNASRAQLVREVIRPALAAGQVVLCDRYYDSTVAYQGYGRELDLKTVRGVIDLAVGETRPDLTLLLTIPLPESEIRRLARNQQQTPERDRIEAADRGFFQRVEQGYQAIAGAEPQRVKVIDGMQSVAAVSAAIWKWVEPLLGEMKR